MSMIPVTEASKRFRIGKAAIFDAIRRGSVKGEIGTSARMIQLVDTDSLRRYVKRTKGKPGRPKGGE